MNVRDALLGRRTVHSYRPEPVPEEVIERALEAAIHAPNHRLTWPWRFLRVGRETRKGLVDIAVQLKSAGVDCGVEQLAALRGKIKGKFLNPHDLIVVTVRCGETDAIRAREDYAACACAIQNLSLSLWSDGVGSKWSSGAPTRHADTYQLLGIDPQAEEIIGFLWVGIADKVPHMPERPPLDSFVRRLP